jgi:hypothetical protein
VKFQSATNRESRRNSVTLWAGTCEFAGAQLVSCSILDGDSHRAPTIVGKKLINSEATSEHQWIHVTSRCWYPDRPSRLFPLEVHSTPTSNCEDRFRSRSLQQRVLGRPRYALIRFRTHNSCDCPAARCHDKTLSIPYSSKNLGEFSICVAGGNELIHGATLNVTKALFHSDLEHHPAAHVQRWVKNVCRWLLHPPRPMGCTTSSTLSLNKTNVVTR